MRSMLSRLNGQRGQVIVMFVGILTIITIAGVIVVDFGLWFSERRAAQTDADLPALAGARECMLELASGGSYTADPVGAVDDFFELNRVSNTTLEYVSPACEEDDQGRLCVTVRVRHDVETWFSSFYSPIFDAVSDDDIGAHATACAGAAQAPDNVVPFEVEKPGPCFQSGEPDFSNLCPLEGSSWDPNPRGMLDLAASEDYCSEGPVPASIDKLIACSAPGICLINEEIPPTCVPAILGPWYKCVVVQDGNPQNVLDGVRCRLMGGAACKHIPHIDCSTDGEGICDTDGNGIDDFDESVDPDPDWPGVYQAKDCDPTTTTEEEISPRLVTVIVLDVVPDPGNDGYPIAAFAAFYLEGCALDDYDPNADGKLTQTELYALFATNPEYRQCDVGNPGHQVVYGRWVRLIVAGSGAGPVDPSTTMFSIALVDWEGGG